MTRLILVTIVALFASATGVTAAAVQNAPLQGEGVQELPGVHYRITPVPQGDRTDLEIEARLSPPWPEQVEIAPPINCYGSGLDLSAALVSIEVEGAPPLPPRDADTGGWTIAVRPEGVTIRYRLSFDPIFMERDAFSPNTSATHFHVAGCQWMLTIGDMNDRREVTVAFTDVPREWSVYSSLAPSGGPGQIRGNEEDTAPTAIGGQQGRSRVFNVEDRPVEVFAAEGFAFSPAEIGTWVERIVSHQRNRMGVFDIPFYTVAVRPRANVVAGTAIDNLFIAFVRPDASRFDIVRNISHEMFHNFIPDRLMVAAPEGQSWARHLWFSEGVVEYMARSLLMEQDLMSPAEMAECLNRDLRDVAENPFAGRPIEAFEDALRRDGQLSQTMKNVSYARGALLAAQWDRRLRSKGAGDLASVFRRLIALEGDEVSEEQLFGVLADYGLDASADFDRCVVGGEQFVPDPDLLGPSFELKQVAVPSFDPGFELTATVRSKSLQGVDAKGPAFAAGLRDDMPLQRLENASRFSSSWNERRPMVVTVLVDGHARRFEFMPTGRFLSVPQFVPRK